MSRSTYVMEYNTTQYLNIVDLLDIDDDSKFTLLQYVKPIYRSEREKRYSEPMIWIGMYIASASLVCILAMVADLLHGLRRRKLWFPCKYFRINAAFLTIISVAMKLPMDLSGSMPGDVDQVAKLGSMAFMCTMMANLLPCLATMDNNALLSNMTALGILVITLVVNVCIQIQTGVVSYKEVAPVIKVILPRYEVKIGKNRNIVLASIYVALLLWLLLIHVCSSLAILKAKKIIESKYQQGHDRASKLDIQPSSLTIETLEKYVKNHWIMAGSGSPQFITACFLTTSASGVICVLVTAVHTLTMFWSIKAILTEDCDSDYGRSMIAILMVQFVGVVIGTIAPLSRCFATLNFKVSFKIIAYHLKVFEVESYWSRKLYDWKQAGLKPSKLPFRSHSLNVIVETLKKLILCFCIEFQEGLVVVCKIIALIPFVFMICVLYCFRCFKWLNVVAFSSSGDNTNSVIKGKVDDDIDPCYVLCLEDEMELAKRTLEGLSKSVNQLIKNGENSQACNNLMKLFEQNLTRGFHGLAKLDHHQYHIHQVPLFLVLKGEHQDCWSLPVVTLTTIAVSLPKIEKKKVDSLWISAREGLEYVSLVEENLNATDHYARSIQQAAKALWKEVDIEHKWLGHKLQEYPSSSNIVEWFMDTAKDIVYSAHKSKDDADDDSTSRSICANSMYRITKTILFTFQANDDNVVIFDSLSSMIADIMAACLTNLPQVITMKCHTSEIEKREGSVKEAAQLLGKTTQIMKTLRDHGIPDMNPSDLPFIDKWRAYLADR